MTSTLRTIQRATLTLFMVGVGVGGTIHGTSIAIGSATGGAGSGRVPAAHVALGARPPCLPCPKVPVQTVIK